MRTAAALKPIVRLMRPRRGGRRVWRLWWRDAAGRLRTCERQGWTRPAALEEARRVEAHLLRSRGDLAWDEFAAAVVKDQQRRNRPSTVATVRSVLATFHRRTGLVWMSDVDLPAIRLYLEALGQERRGATVNRHLRTLKAALRYGRQTGLLARDAPDPCEGMRRVRERHLERVIYESPAEIVRLLSAMQGEGRRWGAGTLLMADAGLRIGEVSHLAWRSVDLDRREVVVQDEQDGWSPKAMGGRLAMSTRLHVALSGLWAAGTGEGRVVGGESPRSFERGLRMRLRRAAKAAGLPPILPHGLRRSYGTILANEGMEAAQLRRVMRHTDIKTTLTYYVRVDERRAGEAARERLEQAR